MGRRRTAVNAVEGKDRSPEQGRTAVLADWRRIEKSVVG
jgi:hypothetical protein